MKISLQNRKRTAEMSETVSKLNQTKKDELLSLKLQSLNEAAMVAGQLFDIPINQIQPDPNQPRKTFKNIESLARSIKEQGVLQPIVVRVIEGKSGYRIIVGERRYHAAKVAGLATLPAILREEEDADTLILQLLENDQREQVSPLEEAAALQKLIQQMGLSKQAIAQELGRDSHWVSMRLGLMEANRQIKELIIQEKVLDLRTLHELRKLSEEEPKLFGSVIKKIKSLNFTGSYRNLIRETRVSKKEQVIPKILKVEYQQGDLSLFLEGKRKPMRFAIDAAVLRQMAKIRF